MSSFIFAIVGVCTLGVLLDVVLPDGEINKYAKGIFSLFAVIAIVSPISEFLSGKKVDFSDVIVDAYVPDESFVDSATKARISEFEEYLSSSVKKCTGVSNEVDVSYSSSRNEISLVMIIFDESVISEREERIYILEKAKALFESEENIDGDIVVGVWR